jgi:hypothetical protein
LAESFHVIGRLIFVFTTPCAKTRLVILQRQNNPIIMVLIFIG